MCVCDCVCVCMCVCVCVYVCMYVRGGWMLHMSELVLKSDRESAPLCLCDDPSGVATLCWWITV